MYYEANVYLSTENILDNGELEEESYQDVGIIETFTGKTLLELRNNIEKNYDLKKFEEIESDRIEATFTNKEDKLIENYNIYFTRVFTEGVSIREFEKTTKKLSE